MQLSENALGLPYKSKEALAFANQLINVISSKARLASAPGCQFGGGQPREDETRL
ncbi:MAG TPA: hypothetical protein VNE38_15160 [Ktedonobacteraceae bacterium]|nr:hypothetical protein [Ktedonobacteraceae bacterium]